MIIKFENGTKVKFDGNPTQADIEEMAAKLGINKKQEVKSPFPTNKEVYQQAGDRINDQITGQGEFAGQSAIQRGVGATATAFNTVPNVIKSQLPEVTQRGIASLGEKIGEKFTWLTDKIASTKLFKEIGDLEAQGYLNPETTPELYRVKESLETATSGGEIAGNILAAEQTAANLTKGVKIAETQMTKIPNPRDAMTLIKGNVKELVGPKITPEIQAKSINSLEEDYYKWVGQTKTGIKNINKVEARTEALNKAGTTGRTPQRVLAENGVVPEIQGTKFATANQSDQFRQKVQPLDEALNLGVKEVDLATSPKPIAELEKSAINRIKSLRITEGAKEAMIKDLKNEFGLMREKYGNAMTTSDMQFEKSPYFNAPKYDSTKPFQGDVNYQVGKSFQEGIEQQALKAGFEDVAQLNREIGDILEAAKFLKSLDGNSLKYGKVGKYAFAIVGASLGTGIVGKILGFAGGEMIGDLLMRADVANPVKRLILRSLEQKSPEAYQATLKWLEEQKALQATRPRLEAPSGASTINQGRPLRVAPEGFDEGGYIGKETIATSQKTLDPLLSEARKYKTAEEFVKAQGTPVYHGTPYDLEGGKLSLKYSGSNMENETGAIFFTDNPQIAKNYSRLPQSEMEGHSYRQSKLISDRVNAGMTEKQARQGGQVVEASIKPKNPLVYDMKGKYYDYELNKRLIEQAKKNGNDVVVIKNVAESDNARGVLGTTYAVIDESAIQTKSQLTDIWKKANGK